MHYQQFCFHNAKPSRLICIWFIANVINKLHSQLSCIFSVISHRRDYQQK